MITGKLICGVDEAGRGPLAGPVVAAAVIFRDGLQIPGLNDSKLLSASQRLNLIPAIIDQVAGFAIAAVSNSVIDRINILQATFLAMRTAVEKLPVSPDIIYVDGQFAIPKLKIMQKSVVNGDRLVPQISAASILAKVARDAYMVMYSNRYPEYNFEKHKGYGTPEHLAILRKFGPCAIHRQSFNPVAQYQIAGVMDAISQ
jgi:ribonuclease HII